MKLHAALAAAVLGAALLSALPAGAQAPAAADPSPTAPAVAPPAMAAPAAAPAGSGATASTGTPPSIRDQLSPEEERRLRALEGELRCLVCQNQTLADSDADLAVDLRRQVESLVAEGRSDQQIKDYLVERYGDFVLYRPPVQRNTLALWIGPFALLGIGILAWLLVQRRSRRRDGVPAPAASAAGDRERARRLLDD